MLFDGKTIYEIRYPCVEEDFMPPLRMCAILDCTQQIGALANAFHIRELNIDLAQADDDIPGHFEKYHPDILMVNTDVLPERYIRDLAKQLEERNASPKLLVSIGADPDRPRYIKGVFESHVHLKTPIYPPRDAEFLEKLFVTRVLSRDYYMEKLSQVVSITLTAMHCKKDSAGFEYLRYITLEVLSSPYRFFGTSQALSKMVADRYSVTVANINSVLSNTISKSVHNMTGAEYKSAFPDKEEKSIPTIGEYVFAAARLSSRPAKHLIYNMLDEPFEYPRRSVKMI